ncbi:MAG TPA: prepilin-type N-terminal cleavage/methylation domain-containing protein [Burkholderiaceae bacterium]|nr:prepilin-type N-terminal cleavage/methylation domain-containing protein [Burkholderiaceae bacterium]
MTHRSSRGVSLVEAMVALAVMAFGMLAVVGVQSTLRFNGDIAKQRSEATRLAQERLDVLRSFTSIDGSGGFDEIVADAGPTPFADLVTNTTFSVRSEVVTYADPPARALRVTVSWTDRAGGAQQVVLASAIAAAAPALSGTLAVRLGTAAVAPVRKPFKRHPTIPVLAKDFGDGRSAFVPPFRPWLVLVFNNITGVIVGVCDFGFGGSTFSNDTITPADVASCDNNTLAQLVSGFVRFWRDTGGSDLTAANVENPPGPALRFRMQLALSSSGHPSGSFCIDDANYDTTFDQLLPFGSYFCIVQSNAGALWSGRTDIQAQRTHVGAGDVDWLIGDTGVANEYRVCRYTPATDDSQVVTNAEHPREYTDVSGNLTDQNFVVIPSVKTCPTDVPANPSVGDLVNSNTLQHQPAP